MKRVLLLVLCAALFNEMELTGVPASGQWVKIIQ
jgi:hypothetical protein